MIQARFAGLAWHRAKQLRRLPRGSQQPIRQEGSPRENLRSPRRTYVESDRSRVPILKGSRQSFLVTRWAQRPVVRSLRLIVGPTLTAFVRIHV